MVMQWGRGVLQSKEVCRSDRTDSHWRRVVLVIPAAADVIGLAIFDSEIFFF